MAFSSSSIRRNEHLDLRLTAQAPQALAAAAAADHRSMGEFVLEGALGRRDELVTVRTRFGLNAEQWSAFHQALDAEPGDC